MQPLLQPEYRIAIKTLFLQPLAQYSKQLLFLNFLLLFAICEMQFIVQIFKHFTIAPNAMSMEKLNNAKTNYK
ncbi:MAG: hypothetical protein NTW59_04080 [Candidatus Diapherotrites archaeon]|nr:hypothetical protein [Candidatus Diapherotrites archaeon]